MRHLMAVLMLPLASGMPSANAEDMPWEIPVDPVAEARAAEQQALANVSLNGAVMRGTSMRQGEPGLQAVLETATGERFTLPIGATVGRNGGAVTKVGDFDMEITESLSICDSSQLKFRVVRLAMDVPAPVTTRLESNGEGGYFECLIPDS